MPGTKSCVEHRKCYCVGHAVSNCVGQGQHACSCGMVSHMQLRTKIQWWLSGSSSNLTSRVCMNVPARILILPYSLRKSSKSRIFEQGGSTAGDKSAITTKAVAFTNLKGHQKGTTSSRLRLLPTHLGGDISTGRMNLLVDFSNSCEGVRICHIVHSAVLCCTLLAIHYVQPRSACVAM